MPRTRDHETIRRWVEERGGKPARVRGTQDLLRISFGFSSKSLEEITWEEFFEAFERNNLMLVYELDPSSRFVLFVRRRSSAE